MPTQANAVPEPTRAASTSHRALHTTTTTYTLDDGRVLNLRVRAPARWRHSSILLSLMPQGDSAGVAVSVIKGGPTKPDPTPVLGPALIDGVASRIDMSKRLLPGVVYTLRISARSGTVVLLGKPELIRVSPQQISAVGDIACSPDDAGWNDGQGTDTRCGQAAVAELVSRRDRRVLVLGDNQYPAGSLADYRAGFDASWGWVGRRLRPILGNHEYPASDRSASGYFDYFSSLNVPTGQRDEGWYSFNLGNWRMIALNTNNWCGTIKCDAGSPQEQWFRQELIRARAAGQCTLAFWHIPRASGGNQRDSTRVDALWRDMVEFGGDVVLNGHDHNYQRFGPLDADAQPTTDGPVEWVVGTGGYSFYDRMRPRAGQEKAIIRTNGLLRLRLSGSGYSWRWVGVDDQGADSGTGSCRP